MKDIKIDIYKLGSNGKTVVELLHFLDKNKNKSDYKSIDSFGITHFAITVSDIDNLYKNLLLNGVKFISDPQINEKKTHKVCFCEDFESNFIELVEEL